MLLLRTEEERTGGAIGPAALSCRCPGDEWYSNDLEYESNAGTKPGLSHPCINRAKLFSPPAGMLEYQPHTGHSVFTSNERELGDWLKQVTDPGVSVDIKNKCQTA